MVLNADVFALTALLSFGNIASAAAVTQKTNVLPNRYIVTLKPEVALDEHLHLVNAIVKRASIEPVIFEGVSHNYTLGNFKAYAGHFDSTVADQLKTHAHIATVEPDRVLTPTIIEASWKPRTRPPVTQKDAGYALNMISHREPTGTDYVYKAIAGRGTYAYIVDTGVSTRHQDFEKRAIGAWDADHDDHERSVDNIGQGTAAASLIGGKTLGVAKKCSLISVKVANKEKTVHLRHVLYGIMWSTKNIIAKKRQAKAVIWLGFDGHGDVTAVTNALDEAYNKGVTVVTAAGNGDPTNKNAAGKDAGFGFNLAKGIIVVAATDKNRKRATFSNWGSKVTLFAPGVDSACASNKNDGGTWTRSGTGVAGAYVAGLVLYLKSVYKLPDAKSTTAKLIELATNDAVKDTKGSPALFAYNGGA